MFLKLQSGRRAIENSDRTKNANKCRRLGFTKRKRREEGEEISRNRTEKKDRENKKKEKERLARQKADEKQKRRLWLLLLLKDEDWKHAKSQDVDHTEMENMSESDEFMEPSTGMVIMEL